MIQVFDTAAASIALARRKLGCPGCGQPLRPWGHARERTVRDPDGTLVTVRPARAPCPGCEVTHVVPGAGLLPRRAYTAGQIGQALVAAVGGHGHRRIARDLAVPAGTVRGAGRGVRDLPGDVLAGHRGGDQRAGGPGPADQPEGRGPAGGENGPGLPDRGRHACAVVTFGRETGGQRAFYSGKYQRHGLNVQTVCSPHGDLLRAAAPRPGAVVDVTAARQDGIAGDILRFLGLFADLGYLGLDREVVTGRRKPRAGSSRPRRKPPTGSRPSCAALAKEETRSSSTGRPWPPSCGAARNAAPPSSRPSSPCTTSRTTRSPRCAPPDTRQSWTSPLPAGGGSTRTGLPSQAPRPACAKPSTAICQTTGHQERQG